MADKEQEERARVVAAAREWLGTPYHHRASVKGHGCDCAQLLVNAFSGAGLMDFFEPAVYSMDWHLHRGEEKYLAEIEQRLKLVDDDERAVIERPESFQPQPGDVLMLRLGRTFSHSALVTQWPYVIHAYAMSQIVEEVDIRGTPLALRPLRVYTYWRDE